MTNKTYNKYMQDWAEKFGDLINWKTRPGQPINQMYRILRISRNSHNDYLTGATEVPSYVMAEVEFFNKLGAFNQHMIAFEKLNEGDIDLKDASDLAIQAWESLVGRKVADESSFVEFAGHFSVRNAHKEMREVMKEDSTGLGVALLIRGYISEYMGAHSFNHTEMIKGSHKADKLMSSYARIQAALNTSSLGGAIHAFTDNAQRAVEFYRPDVSESDRKAVAESAFDLFLNAKKAFKGFSKYTVSKGNVAPNTQLKLQEQIFVFNSMEELVSRSVDMPNGFALSLIRTERYTDSFFCMTIKHDGMVYLVADKSTYGNPLTQDFMAGRNQRYNESRMGESFMPYEMMNVVFSDGGRVADVEGTELAVSDDGLRVLGHIKSMAPYQILWFTFLLEEAKLHFMGVDTPKHIALGYFSSSTLEHPLALENKASDSNKNLPSTYVAKQGIKTLSSKRLSRKKMIEHSPGIAKASYANQWMEDMFDAQIEEQHLYIPPEVCTEKGDSLLLGDSSKKAKPTLSMVNVEGMDYFAHNKIEKDIVPLKSLPSTLFGSTQEIQKQADYIARHNKAKTIGRLVRRDYEENEGKIQTWIAKRIAENMPNLIDDIISLNHQRFFILQHIDRMQTEGLMPIESDLIRQVHAKYMEFDDMWVDTFRKPEQSPLAKALKVRRKNERTARCYFNNTQDAEYRFKLQVSNVYDLEILTGIPREKMPKQLQTWGLKSVREAGPLDASYDPMQDVSNPWNEMLVTCVIPVSIEALKEKRKELGLKGVFVPPRSYYESSIERRMMGDKFKDTPEYKKYNECSKPMAIRDYNAHKPRFSYYWQE